MKGQFLILLFIFVAGSARANVRSNFSNHEVITHVLGSPTLTTIPDLKGLELNAVMMVRTGENLSSRYEVVLQYTTYFPEGQGITRSCNLSAHVSIQRRETILRRSGGPLISITTGLSTPRFTQPECGE